MSLSNTLINGFIKSELELFKKHFNDDPVPEIQDKRSLAIAWLSYYFKSSISKANVSEITGFVRDVHLQENYHTHGWFRISALQASAFILSSDTHYSTSLIQHIDCGQSWTRGFIIKSVGIMCPLLSFDNYRLLNATESNLRHYHSYSNENILVLLSTNGTTEEKLDWLEAESLIKNKDYYKQFVNGSKTYNCGEKTDFFIKSFSEIKSYVIFKMLSQPFLAEVQSTLFDDANLENLMELEKKHPLNEMY
jgi:hypothetical protein